MLFVLYLVLAQPGRGFERAYVGLTQVTRKAVFAFQRSVQLCFADIRKPKKRKRRNGMV